MATPTRDTILDAALGVFAERGFHGASMPVLAEAAGVGSGTPYRHFESKEALVNALYRRTKDALMGALLVDFPFDATEREQFRVFFFRLVGFFREHPDAFDFLELHHHQPYLTADNLELERRALAPVLAFFEHGRRARVTRAMAPEALLAIVWGVFSGLFKAWRLGHLTATDELWAQAEASAWDAIRRPDPDHPTIREGEP
ncbi:MAG: TetR/AcrR family transcriptional regulator [Sandaracinaceae bacterium]|nr:TetR/AcrR family transcriptional regulator [Sandaracinaceae bacterium]